MELLLVIGPPAVGKMSVGKEIAARSDFRLFHNHHTIEPLVEIFGYGSPPFKVLNLEFRRRVIEEAVRHDVNLIFTFVWNLDDPSDTHYVEELLVAVEQSGSRVHIVELAADLDTRLERNRGGSRLDAKPSKRDLVWSDNNVRQMQAHQMNTDPTGNTPTPADDFLARHRRLRIETDHLSAKDVAQQVLAWLAEGEPAGDVGADGVQPHNGPA